MARAATSRPKCRAPIGLMPALQYLLPEQLAVDPTYQRSTAGGDSQALIRKIAQHWNWDLCQPLVVSRRKDGGLYVIDGQHRLMAARLRGDIAQLPAVVVQYGSAADEAASFVALNRQRRPLSRIDLFKAAVAAGDDEAGGILQAIAEAGLSLAPHTNHTAWKPGMVSNIAGIEQAWRKHGPRVTLAALQALSEGFAGEVLRYAGSLFPGIVAVCAERPSPGRFDDDLWGWLIELLRGASQEEWRQDIARLRIDEPNLRYSAASEEVFRRAWVELLDTDVPAEAE